jgi:toxin CptA
VLLPARLRLKHSPTLAAALVFAHGALAVILMAVLPLPAGLASAGLLACVLAFHLLRHVIRPSVLALQLGADGKLQIERRGAVWLDAAVLPGVVVFPWLIVLRLRVDGRVCSLAIPFDGVAREAHRDLRLWLRWLSTDIPDY